MLNINKVLRVTSLLSAFICFYGIAGAQDGVLDPDFGHGGIVVTDFGAYENFQGMAIQPDGKIIACGVIADTVKGSRAMVLRFLENGQLDPGFGLQGKAEVIAGNEATNPFAIALQSDGKILIAGTAADSTPDGSGDIFLARLKADGPIDTDFGNSGIIRLYNYGHFELAYAMAVQPSGKIIITGVQEEQQTSHLVVFRFLPDGSPDPSFAVNGRFSWLENSLGIGLCVGQDGKFLVLGQKFEYEKTNMIAFNEDGSLNNHFGDHGVQTLDLIPDNSWERAYSCLYEKDGAILLGGFLGGFGVARILPDGSPDPNFGEGGLARANFPDNRYFLSNGACGLKQSDGKILVPGFLQDGIDNNFAVLRFDSKGRIDEGFGDKGWVVTDVTDAADDCFAAAIQSDQKLVLCGYSWGPVQNDALLVRYLMHPDPVAPTPGEIPPPRILPNPNSGKFKLEYTLSAASSVSLDLYDVAGKWLGNLLTENEAPAGLNTKPFDLTEKPDGVYLLKLKKEGKSNLLRLVKLH